MNEEKTASGAHVPCIDLLAILADCLDKEADSCNDYQKVVASRQQSDDLWHRAGLLGSIAAALRDASTQIANKEL